jgi:Spy/CpxP family protein refolding chaperone
MFLRKTAAAAAFGLVLVSSICVLAQQTQTTPGVKQPEGFTRGARLKGTRGRHGRGGLGLAGLNLTEEQRQRTLAILEQHLESTKAQREELMKLREKRLANVFTDQDAARARDLHSQLRESRQSIRSQIESTLTPEQRTQWEQFQTEQKARREEMLNRRWRRKDPIQ